MFHPAWYKTEFVDTTLVLDTDATDFFIRVAVDFDKTNINHLRCHHDFSVINEEKT